MRLTSRASSDEGTRYAQNTTQAQNGRLLYAGLTLVLFYRIAVARLPLSQWWDIALMLAATTLAWFVLMLRHDCPVWPGWLTSILSPGIAVVDERIRRVRASLDASLFMVLFCSFCLEAPLLRDGTGGGVPQPEACPADLVSGQTRCTEDAGRVHRRLGPCVPGRRRSSLGEVRLRVHWGSNRGGHIPGHGLVERPRGHRVGAVVAFLAFVLPLGLVLGRGYPVPLHDTWLSAHGGESLRELSPGIWLGFVVGLAVWGLIEHYTWLRTGAGDAYFTYLKNHLGISDGNLLFHLRKLGEAGYVTDVSRRVGSRRLTFYRLT